MCWLLLVSILVGCRDRPDVIILTVDTLRVDHVSSFSEQSPAQTPSIDGLAKDGVRFTQAYSPISVTGPAFVSLMTGQDISTHGVTMNVFRGGVALSNEEDTLAERFKDKGYKTAAFVSGFTLRPYLGLAQGFDVYDSPSKRQSRRWGDQTAQNTIDWLQAETGRVFLWYHTYDAHGPWTKWGKDCEKKLQGTEGETEWERIPKYQRFDNCIDTNEYKKRYAKAVQFADLNVGMVIDALKEQKRYDDALIVLLADHGESFTERELWFDHGTTAHEEQLHIPLIIKYPKNIDAGSIDERLVSLMDIAPTITEKAALKALPKATGNSIEVSYTGAKYILGESSHCKDNPILSCSPIGPKGKIFSIRDSKTALFLQTDKLLQYDRSIDPMEENLLEVTSSLRTPLQKLAEERRIQVKDLVWPPNNKKSSETEMLRSLGYIEQ